MSLPSADNILNFWMAKTNQQRHTFFSLKTSPPHLIDTYQPRHACTCQHGDTLFNYDTVRPNFCENCNNLYFMYGPACWDQPLTVQEGSYVGYQLRLIRYPLPSRGYQAVNRSFFKDQHNVLRSLVDQNDQSVIYEAGNNNFYHLLHCMTMLEGFVMSRRLSLGLIFGYGCLEGRLIQDARYCNVTQFDTLSCQLAQDIFIGVVYFYRSMAYFPIKFSHGNISPEMVLVRLGATTLPFRNNHTIEVTATVTLQLDPRVSFQYTNKYSTNIFVSSYQPPAPRLKISGSWFEQPNSLCPVSQWGVDNTFPFPCLPSRKVRRTLIYTPELETMHTHSGYMVSGVIDLYLFTLALLSCPAFRVALEGSLEQVIWGMFTPIQCQEIKNDLKDSFSMSGTQLRDYASKIKLEMRFDVFFYLTYALVWMSQNR